MDAFAETHQFIKVNDGKKCYSLGLIEERDHDEVLGFYNELGDYLDTLGLYNSQITIIAQVDNGIKQNNNHFMCSNVHPNSFVSETPNRDSLEGGYCLIVLQMNPNNKNILNLSIKIISESDNRETIC